MIYAGDRKNVLVVSAKQDAEPVLDELRAAGHQVSLVEGIDEARTLLESGGFDQTLLPASALALLLEQRAVWVGANTDAWRQSTLGIAHDLRGLLRTLDGSIRELGDAERDELRAGDDLGQLRRAVSVLSTFLLELTIELEGGADQELSLSAINLEDVVETAAMAIYPSALERQQRLVVDIHDEVTEFQADQTKMKRIMTNLLGHASREGADLGVVRVRAEREGDSCLISVLYSGDTMTLAELRRLFSPVSIIADVRGAGLSRVQRLVEQHSGRVWVESQKGSGTCIFVSLPLPVAAFKGDAGLVKLA